MFYLTTHTIAQNQFANISTEHQHQLNGLDVHQLPSPDPFLVCIDPLRPCGLTTTDDKKQPIVLLPFTIDQFSEKTNCDLNEIIIADALRNHTTSICSTKSLLSDTSSDQSGAPEWGGETIFVIMMALIFALLLLTLISLVCIKIIG